jgi:hypothetical protein
MKPLDMIGVFFFGIGLMITIMVLVVTGLGVK